MIRCEPTLQTIISAIMAHQPPPQIATPIMPRADAQRRDPRDVRLRREEQQAGEQRASGSRAVRAGTPGIPRASAEMLNVSERKLLNVVSNMLPANPISAAPAANSSRFRCAFLDADSPGVEILDHENGSATSAI